MLVRSAFEYSVVRVVPRVDREEFVNAGIILYCDKRALLRARIELDEARLLALWPATDLVLVRRHLAAIPRICAGDPAGEMVARLPVTERWRWLVSERSTTLQASPSHGVLGTSADEILDHLVATVVRILPAS